MDKFLDRLEDIVLILGVIVVYGMLFPSIVLITYCNYHEFNVDIKHKLNKAIVVDKIKKHRIVNGVVKGVSYILVLKEGDNRKVFYLKKDKWLKATKGRWIYFVPDSNGKIKYLFKDKNAIKARREKLKSLIIIAIVLLMIGYGLFILRLFVVMKKINLLKRGI